MRTGSLTSGAVNASPMGVTDSTALAGAVFPSAALSLAPTLLEIADKPSTITAGIIRFEKRIRGPSTAVSSEYIASPKI